MTTPQTILVTGGAGFIGSHTCKRLAAHGHLPVAFDNLSRGHSRAVRWGPLVVGDIRDPAALLLDAWERGESSLRECQAPLRSRAPLRLRSAP